MNKKREPLVLLTNYNTLDDHRIKRIVGGSPLQAMKLLFLFMMFSQTTGNNQVTAELMQFRHNKDIPYRIEKNVLKALSFFPELKNTKISFLLKSDIHGAVMQAQPVFRTLIRNRKNRRYRINISEYFKLIDTNIPIEQIPDDVIIGWIGHELGHILDYEHKTGAAMVAFGCQYYFSPRYVKRAEMIADTLAVERGLGNYIVATKRFILNHAHLPQAYKDKIARLYLSPDVILEQVKKLEEKNLAAQQAKPAGGQTP